MIKTQPQKLILHRGFRAMKKSSSSSLGIAIHEEMKDLKVQKGFLLPVSGRSCFAGKGLKAVFALISSDKGSGVFDEIEAFFNGNVGFAMRTIHEERGFAKFMKMPRGRF